MLGHRGSARQGNLAATQLDQSCILARCSVPLCSGALSTASQPVCRSLTLSSIGATSRSAFTPHRRLVETIPAQRHACLSCPAAEETSSGGGGFPHQNMARLCDVCVGCQCACAACCCCCCRRRRFCAKGTLQRATVQRYIHTSFPSQASPLSMYVCVGVGVCTCVCLCLGNREHGEGVCSRVGARVVDFCPSEQGTRPRSPCPIVQGPVGSPYIMYVWLHVSK